MGEKFVAEPLVSRRLDKRPAPLLPGEAKFFRRLQLVDVRANDDLSLGRRQRAVFHRTGREFVQGKPDILRRVRIQHDRRTGGVDARRWVVHEEFELQGYQRFDRGAGPSLSTSRSWQRAIAKSRFSKLCWNSPKLVARDALTQDLT